MITKLQITGKLHYHRKCDFQLSKRKLGYRTLLPLTAPITVAVCGGVSAVKRFHHFRLLDLDHSTLKYLGL